MSGTTGEGHALETRVTIAARPETVFGFFTNEADFGAWMGAAHGVAKLEPRVGGTLSVEFPAAGKFVRGEVVAMEPPHRFAFTWGYEDGKPFDAGTTLVEIRLEPIAEGTLLVLRHTGLPSETAALDHTGGWRLYSSVLAGKASERQLHAAAGVAVDAWFAAWSETDAGRRAELLAQCLAAEGEFRHEYAAICGIDALSAHIAQSQAVMQGVKLEPGGAWQLCHGALQFPWQAIADGQTVARGSNFARLDLDGKFAAVHGFTDRDA